MVKSQYQVNGRTNNNNSAEIELRNVVDKGNAEQQRSSMPEQSFYMTTGAGGSVCDKNEIYNKKFNQGKFNGISIIFYILLLSINE